MGVVGLTGCDNRLAEWRFGPAVSKMSAGGLSVAAGLAEREMSIGDDLGRSESSSRRELPARKGGVWTSDSLDGDELSVAILLSLSRKPPTSTSSPLSFSMHRSLPFVLRVGGSVNGVVARGDCILCSVVHQLWIVGRRTRFSSGAVSSLDIELSDDKPLLILDDGELDVDDESAKSDNEVDNEGRTGESVISWSLDNDDMADSAAELIDILDLRLFRARSALRCVEDCSGILGVVKNGGEDEGKNCGHRDF